MHYRAIIRYEDGRPADHYELGEVMDLWPMWEQRRLEGKLMPIGSAWGSYTEIWCVTAKFAFALPPACDADLKLCNDYIKAALRGEAP